ncbi:hypothetical protein D4R51_01215 [bacterium]|nr:MAG: hypothetical protein D4R51_01215 [bacterium]
MNKKSILLGSVAILGLFVALFLITPAFALSGFGRMMGGNHSGQNWGQSGYQMFHGNGRGNVGNNSWGMMNENGNYGGMMGNWR